MVAFNKYNCFSENLAEKVHNLGSDTLKIALTNAVPNVAHTNLSQIGEISAGNGYTAGGNTAAVNASAQTGGVYKLTLNDPATWVATGGSIGPFRYAVLYNATAGGALIGWWDYGASITLAVTQTFTADLDQVNGVLTVT